MHKYKIVRLLSTASENHTLKAKVLMCGFLILKMAKFKAKLRGLADNPQIVCEHDFADERKL